MEANKASSRGKRTNLNLRFVMIWIVEKTGKRDIIVQLVKRVTVSEPLDLFL